MNNINLTDRTIQNTKPKDAQYELYDSDVRGLTIRVSPSGAKTFSLLYKMGKNRRLTLGRYPSVSLAEARQRARQALSEISRGVDPANEKRLARRNYENYLFSHVIEDYVENYAKINTRSWNETNRILQREFAPEWKNVSLDKIKRQDVLNLLDKIRRRSPSAANHAFAAIRGFFNWCVSRGYLQHSSCAGLRMPSKAQSRDRVLTDTEIAAIWNACDQIGYPFGTITKLLFLTGQRRNEVAEMEWADVDLINGIWTQPSSKNKSARKHIVPLSSVARDVLQHVLRVHDDLVFPARGKDRAASGFSKWKVKMDQLTGVTRWTLHDTRRTVATKLAALGIPIHVTELILNHSSTKLSGVTGVYNRHEYLQERREALERWADHLSGLLYKTKP